MPTPWNEDRRRDRRLIESNTLAVARSIYSDASRREPPTLELARAWHKGIYSGVPVPVAYYVGDFRDSDPALPELMNYEVRVGTVRAVACADVPRHLARFERQMQTAAARLDRAIPFRQPPTPAGPELHAILTFSALAYGKWVRIHPFVNGNGRTARLWVLWVGARYGLPPYVRIKPRPEGHAYAAAAAASMRGDHAPMVAALNDMLAERMRRGQGAP